METVRSYPGWEGARDREERATLSELIGICLRNCANSFMALALESDTKSVHGTLATKSESGPSVPRYIWNVWTLLAHIPDEWRDGEYEMVVHEKDACDKCGTANTDPFKMHHRIIQLLIKRGELAPTKTPRTLVE